MSDKILTFELTSDKEQLEIHGNRMGIQELINLLSRVVDTSSHDHLMTPSWGGNELTEEKQGESNNLINKVTVHIWK